MAACTETFCTVAVGDLHEGSVREVLSSMKATIRKLGAKGVILAFAAFSLCALMVGIDIDDNHKLFALLLGIGLLNATFGINLKGLTRQDWKLIVLAITVGVVCKAAFAGFIMWGITRDSQYLVLGIAVAQIDPVSVSVLMQHSRLSDRGKDVLRAVSSLDDPVSILLVVTLLMLQPALGVDFGLSGMDNAVDSLVGAGEYFIHNFAFMAAMVMAFDWVYRGSDLMKLFYTAVFLSGAVIIGTTLSYAFGIALIGLFMRPKDAHIMAKVEKLLGWLGNAAFGVAIGVVVYLIVEQDDAILAGMGPGMLLGGLVFAAHVIFTPALTKGSGLDRQDKWYLAFGHQNGVTAIMLGLTINALPVILPAIVFTHVLRMIATLVLDRRFPARSKSAV